MPEQTLLEELSEILNKAQEELDGIKELGALESWRVSNMGRKGRLTLLLRKLGSLPPKERRVVGIQANKAKAALESRLFTHHQTLKEKESSDHEGKNQIDVTLPGRPIAMGRLHPVTQIVREICDAFVSMGFDTIEGPEVEWEHYNFDSLNIPRDHPARDMWDTLWIDWTDPTIEQRRMLLRTHTSPMQARIMEAMDPPIRVVVPGKVFRYEASDATHEWHFFQVEGLAIDTGITFAHLKGTLYEFARLIFGADRQVRFRCDYFPFVEPGVEMAIDCFVCKGRGCRICKDTGWIEIMGAGMVHPKVLEGVGYNPSKYTGFAFGIGPERVAMLKYGIDDIRLFYNNDVRFLSQF
ncbi:phenylalanine--tRNA ligase subunit alpha [Dehalococcoidia bacterium]|nr:phenylalanine--tRNA ligase subunit alpha [Dehalococcoidia bacterium]